MSSNSSTALLRKGERLGEETKTSKCISICKVPDLSCRWGKRLESLTILLLQIVFYSHVSEFLLRKTCLSYSSSFLFVIEVFLWIRYITLLMILIRMDYRVLSTGNSSIWKQLTHSLTISVVTWPFKCFGKYANIVPYKYDCTQQRFSLRFWTACLSLSPAFFVIHCHLSSFILSSYRRPSIDQKIINKSKVKI